MPNGITWKQDTLTPKLQQALVKRRAKMRAAITGVATSWHSMMVPRTPVQYGTLRGTLHVGDIEMSGNVMSINIDAGGPSASYGVYVHEDLTANHPVGQAKFIESVVMEQGPFMNEQLMEHLTLAELF